MILLVLCAKNSNMIKKIKNKTKSFFIKVYRNKTHSQMIETVINKHINNFEKPPVFIEIGCGKSTLTMDLMSKIYQANTYSLDIDENRINRLKSESKNNLNHINFLVGDSLQTLKYIVDKYKKIDFVFFDSSASAMQTFREFLLLENHFSDNAAILIDNASIPNKQFVITPVRKGKILVPYLLSSNYWEVHSHIRAGDSMISALYHRKGGYADPKYERK